MRSFVGVTDWDWFQQLREAAPLEEVNFWQPGGKQRFRALEPGELFLFKLHSPRNFIVGGGIFTYSTILPVSLAWESFEFRNGARSFDAMRRRIERYRRAPHTEFEDYDIGCILLSQPFFLAESEWIPAPHDWAPNIVQGRRYDLAQEPGASLLRRIQEVVSGVDLGLPPTLRVGDDSMDHSRRYGAPTLVTPRLGQGTFRVLVTDAYDRSCAITGERVLPVLQAAHIRPFAREGPHRVQNGILLRSDLHTLFDRGYVTVKPDLRVEISQRLHEDFNNGRDYYALRGRSLRPPRILGAQPHEEFLAWHNQNVFRG